MYCIYVSMYLSNYLGCSAFSKNGGHHNGVMVFLPIYLSSIHLSDNLSIYLSMYLLSIYLTIYLSDYLSIYVLSSFLPIYPSL